MSRKFMRSIAVMAFLVAAVLAAWMAWRQASSARPAASVPAAPDIKGPRPLADLQRDRAREKAQRKPEPAPAPMPGALGAIVRKDAASFEERLAAIHRLGNHLAPAEVQTLLDFLRQPLAESGLETTAFNALKNDAAAVLLRQAPPVPDLPEAFIAMYRDQANDVAWRSYCVQYVGSCYEREGAQGLVTNALWEAAAEKDTPVAGTSLLMLEYLSANHEEIGRPRALELAENLALDPQACLANRITALSLCGRMGSTNMLAATQRLAANEPDAVLRMTAIATLGYLGGSNDLPALEGYALEQDGRIKKSAAGALKRLRDRLAAINQ